MSNQFAVWCDPENVHRPMYIDSIFDTKEDAEARVAKQRVICKNLKIGDSYMIRDYTPETAASRYEEDRGK